jgi:glycosyltransferase involved in cell wall biosynthesis
LIGFTDRTDELKQMTERYPNVVYLGPRPYHTVPAYIKAFDVCLIPYKKGGRIDTVNPVKLNEYLIFGSPVICLKTHETEKYGRYVYLYDDIKELGGILEQIAAEKHDDPLRRERIEFAFNNSWEKRVDRIDTILGGCHEHKNQ